MFSLNRSFIIFILFTILLVACDGAPETVGVTPVAPPAVTRLPGQATEGIFTASLSEIVGNVLARTAQEPSFLEAKNGYVVQVLGQVQTQTDGRARLDFSTGSLVRLGPNTLFTLQPPEEAPQGLLIRIRLEVGRLWVILQGGSLEVETKSGVAAVRGSYMSVSYNPDSGETGITCLEGNCSLATPQGTVQITAGQTAVVTGAGEPPHIGNMDDQDVQEWLNNNPEAAVVVPAQTEAPVSTEIPEATEVPSTSAPPLPPVVVIPPAPTEKVSPPEELEPPAPTSTGTATAIETSPPTLLVPLVEILSPMPAVVGDPVSITIIVSSASGEQLVPTGTVWVTSGTTTLCTDTDGLGSTGDAFCSFTPAAFGDISLEAHYSGDTYFYGGFSTPVVLPVKFGTTTTISSTPNPSTTGDLVVFTAVVAPIPPGSGLPTGSVTYSFSSSGTCLATAEPWTCEKTFSAPSGPETITATYSGDANFAPSTSETYTQNFYLVALKPPGSFLPTFRASYPFNIPGQILDFIGN